MISNYQRLTLSVKEAAVVIVVLQDASVACAEVSVKIDDTEQREWVKDQACILLSVSQRIRELFEQ